MFRTLRIPQIIIQKVLSQQIKALSDAGAASADPKKKSNAQREKLVKITLINVDNSVTVVSLDEANKIAHSKDLRLVKSTDVTVKSLRPIYKLLTNSQYHAEGEEKRSENKAKKAAGEQKGIKNLTISSNIGEHDFQTKVKNLINFIKKRYEVRVVISAEAGSIRKSESLLEKIESQVGVMGKTVQKRIVSAELKFRIIPTKEATTLSKEQPKQEMHTSSGHRDDNL